MKRTGWTGRFTVTQGERQVVYNTIQPAGLEMTLNLWAGITTETMQDLRLLNAAKDASVTMAASFTVLSDRLQSEALFEGTDVTFVPAFVQMLSSAGNLIAEVAVDGLAQDEPVVVEREDILAINTGA